MILELAVGNVVRRVLHIIREEDASLTTAAVGGLSSASESDDEDEDEDDIGQDDHPVLSASAVAAAARNALRPPSLQTLLEDIPHPTAAPRTSSSGGDSEGISKCKISRSHCCNNYIQLQDMQSLFSCQHIVYLIF